MDVMVLQYYYYSITITITRHVKFQLSNFFLSPPHHSLLAFSDGEKKSTQLHTLIDFHSDFDEASHWVPATYAPPCF